MAPVGHTRLQSTQLYSQYPIPLMSTGVQIPSNPASDNDGWITLVGQTFMHSPHFIHLRRKSFSAREPGGLITRGCGEVPEVMVLRITGKITAPARALSISLRRLTSSGMCAALEGLENP